MLLVIIKKGNWLSFDILYVQLVIISKLQAKAMGSRAWPPSGNWRNSPLGFSSTTTASLVSSSSKSPLRKPTRRQKRCLFKRRASPTRPKLTLGTLRTSLHWRTPTILRSSKSADTNGDAIFSLECLTWLNAVDFIWIVLPKNLSIQCYYSCSIHHELNRYILSDSQVYQYVSISWREPSLLVSEPDKDQWSPKWHCKPCRTHFI